MKPGRNSPCPCGSGKKYKRCCLKKDEARRAEEERLRATTSGSAGWPGSLGDEPFGLGAVEPRDDPFGGGVRLELNPYSELRELEDTPVVRKLRKSDPEQWTFATAPGVATLSTEAIQERLAGSGIDASRDAFARAAEGKSSAWEIGDEWLADTPDELLPPFVDKFLGLAACELWKRFIPDRPSLEMLDDRMQEGYERAAARDETEACRIWLDVWDGVRARLEPEWNTLSAAEEHFKCRQLLFNWTQDVVFSLLNAAIDSTSYAECGVRYLDELLDQFSAEGDSYRRRARADRGALLFRADRSADGERVLRELIAERPDEAMGYCYLADELGCTDPKRALEVLQSARDVPVKDGAEWDLEARLRDHAANPPLEG